MAASSPHDVVTDVAVRTRFSQCASSIQCPSAYAVHGSPAAMRTRTPFSLQSSCTDLTIRFASVSDHPASVLSSRAAFMSRASLPQGRGAGRA